MGLLGCPASFQRLMEKVLDKIKNIIVFIHDVIIHTASHEHLLKVLDDVLQRLEHHNRKINLAKCFCGSWGLCSHQWGLDQEKKNWSSCSTCLLLRSSIKFGVSLGCAISFETTSRTLPSLPNRSTDSPGCAKMDLSTQQLSRLSTPSRML